MLHHLFTLFFFSLIGWVFGNYLGNMLIARRINKLHYPSYKKSYIALTKGGYTHIFNHNGNYFFIQNLNDFQNPIIFFKNGHITLIDGYIFNKYWTYYDPYALFWFIRFKFWFLYHGKKNTRKS